MVQGKPVTAKRLHSRTKVDFMTLQDERVCQAVQAVPQSYSSRLSYELDADKALVALAEHPLVFRADAPSTRVEVSRAEPQLRVTTKGREVKIELVPRIPYGSEVVATSDAPTHLTVTEFGPQHREIFEVIGRNGLVAPTDSKEKILRAVSSVSALVTVHSDIDGGGTDAEDVRADSTPHIHLTPYEEGLRVEALVRPFVNEGPTYIPGKGGEAVFATVGGGGLVRDATSPRKGSDTTKSCPLACRSKVRSMTGMDGHCPIPTNAWNSSTNYTDSEPKYWWHGPRARRCRYGTVRHRRASR